MRFEVPQFTDIEPKVVGPLTWKQFVYLAGGAGFLLMIYLSLPKIFFLMIGIPVGVFSGSLAFHKVNDRPLSFFVEAVVNYILKNKLYLWRREKMQNIIEHNNVASSSANLAYTNKKTISSLAHTLETHHATKE